MKTMFVKVKDVWATNVDHDIKKDYKILGELDNGIVIELSDVNDSAYVLELGRYIDCLICAVGVGEINSVDFSKGHEPSKPIFTGLYLGRIAIPKVWWNYNELIRGKRCHAVQTVNGKILIDLIRNHFDIKVGEIITFSEKRLDLLAWQ